MAPSYIESNVVTPKSTTPEAESIQTSLSKLPAELVDIVATGLDKPGLRSMRATCRNLSDDSALEFYRRYTACKIAFGGRYLHIRRESPNLEKAEAMAKPLMASLPAGSTVQRVSQRLQAHSYADAQYPGVEKSYARDLTTRTLTVSPFIGIFFVLDSRHSRSRTLLCVFSGAPLLSKFP